MDKDIIIDGLMDRLGCDRGAAEECVGEFFAWTPDEVIEGMDEYDAIDEIIEILGGADEP